MWGVYRQHEGERRHHFAPLLPTWKLAYAALYWLLVMKHWKPGETLDDYGIEWVGH